MQRTGEMGLTDRLQNFNLISREHLYGDTNQTTVFPLSRSIKTASQLKWQKKKKRSRKIRSRHANCRKSKDIKIYSRR